MICLFYVSNRFCVQYLAVLKCIKLFLYSMHFFLEHEELRIIVLIEEEMSNTEGLTHTHTPTR